MVGTKNQRGGTASPFVIAVTGTCPESDANAKLIAAAPELFEALLAEEEATVAFKKYRAALGQKDELTEGGIERLKQYADRVVATRKRANDLRAQALAKAEGREP